MQPKSQDFGLLSDIRVLQTLAEFGYRMAEVLRFAFIAPLFSPLPPVQSTLVNTLLQEQSFVPWSFTKCVTVDLECCLPLR